MGDVPVRGRGVSAVEALAVAADLRDDRPAGHLAAGCGSIMVVRAQGVPGAEGAGAPTDRVDRPAFMLVCRARSRLCALRAAEIVETMRPLPVEPWVGMPAFVLGVSLIRGVPTPIVDVGALFGDSAPQAFTRFVTLRVGDRRVALAVEEVIGMRGVDTASSIETPPL